jgi:hypothetical protein
VVISIGMLTAGSDPAGYYLARRAGCPAEYYTGAGERAGVWLGRGAAAAALAGELDGEGERVLRALLGGRAPDRRVLIAPVLRADSRGRLATRPLIDAIRAEVDRRDLTVEGLLDNPTDRIVFTALAAGIDRPRRRVVKVSPARAGRLAAAAGLDPHAVYRKINRTSSAQDNRLDNFDRYAAALAYAGRRVDVRRPGIDVTVSAPKLVSVLYALGDPETAAAVRAAHQAAVGQALGYLSRQPGTGCADIRATASAPPELAPRAGSWPGSSTAPPAPGTPSCTPISWSRICSRGPTASGLPWIPGRCTATP